MQLTLRERATQDFSDVVQVEGRIAVANLDNPGAPAALESNLTGVLRSKTARMALQTSSAASAESPAPSGIGASVRRLLNRKTPAAAQAPSPSFEVTLARDAPGVGWVGALSEVLFGCGELALKRTDGTPSEGIRRLTIEEAFDQAELSTAFVLETDEVPGPSKTSPTRPVLNPLEPTRMTSTEPWRGAPWLRLAADLGSSRAAALLGRAYEHGLGVPKDITRAAGYYVRAARFGDPSGLRGMARLSASGEGGLTRNDGLSHGMTTLAARTQADAGRLCASKAAVDQFGALVLAQFRLQRNSLMNVALSALMEQTVDIQSLAFERVEALAVSSPGAPFICKVTARRINAKVTDHTPYRQWAHIDDRYGIVLYYTDNEFDRSWNRMQADVQTLLLNSTPAIDYIEARPIGPDRWRLTLLDNDPFGSLRRGVFVDIQTR